MSANSQLTVSGGWLFLTIALAVIAVAHRGKASFVCSYVQVRLKGQYNGKWALSLTYMLIRLITTIRAITHIEIHGTALYPLPDSSIAVSIIRRRLSLVLG